jgi:hypothetical protein
MTIALYLTLFAGVLQTSQSARPADRFITVNGLRPKVKSLSSHGDQT